MTTAYDVPTKELIDALAKKLEKDDNVTPPDWGHVVATGVHKENPPVDQGWWHTRCASILRKVYVKDYVGVVSLKKEYSGKKDRGSKPYKVRSGSGSIVRAALQQLEKAGLVKKVRSKGRTITAQGRSLVDNTASEVLKKLKERPRLKKY